MNEDNPQDERDCIGKGVTSNEYVCTFSLVEQMCVEIVRSPCTELTNYETAGRNRIRLLSGDLTQGDCQNLQTSDNSKYNCVLKNEYRCMEEGKSECLKTTLYQARRRLAGDLLNEEDCEGLGTTKGKKCVLSEDQTRCDEVDFSFGLNINKLSLFVFCLLFFL